MREMLYRSLARAILICALGVSGLVGYAQPGTIVSVQSEDFNSCSQPAGWSTNILVGTWDWTFNTNGVFGGSMNGSCAAVFDDDAAGIGNTNHAELISPSTDVSSYANVTLEFNYNNEDLGGHVFNVSVWDGSQWVIVFTVQGVDDPIGFSGQSFASVDVSAHKNANFQVMYEYEDLTAGHWGWGVGVDNHEVLGQIPFQYDAQVTNNLGDPEYTQIPISQTPTEVIATAENIGTDPLTNVVVTTEITDGITFFSQSSLPQSLAPGQTFDFPIPGGFIPPNAGTWSFTSSVTVDEPEGDLTNNTTPTVDQFYSDSVYSRDNTIPVNAFGWNPGFGGGSFANAFRIVKKDILRGGVIDLGFPGFAGGPAAGAEYELSLYEFDYSTGLPGDLITQTTFEVPTSNYQTDLFLDFDQEIVVDTGMYVLALDQDDPDQPIFITMTNTITTPSAHFFANPLGNWATKGNSAFAGFNGNVPMIRMVFSSSCMVVNAGPDTTVCVDEPVTLGADSTAELGVPPYTFNWSPPAGLDDPTSPNPTWVATSNVDSPYVQQFVVTASDDAGCTRMDTVLITVNPKDTAALFLPNTDYCIGGPGDTIDYQPVGGIVSGPGVIILDSTGFGGSGGGGPCTPTTLMTLNQPNNTGNPGGMVYFEVDNTSGVPIDITEIGMHMSASSIVNIYTKPGTFAGFEANAAAWTLTATADGTIGPWSGPLPGNGTITPCPVNGTWTLPPGLTGIALETPTAQHLYTNGTGANQTYTNPDMTIQLGTATNFPFAAPVFSPRVWNGHLTYCVGGAGGGSGPLYYFDPDTAGPGTHLLTYCFENEYGCTFCDTFEVTVHPRPDVTIDPVIDQCLNGENIFLTAATPLGTWSGPGIVDPIAGEFDPSQAGVGDHTVYYELVDPNGCYNIDSTVIRVNDNPIADAGADSTICEGETVVIGGNPTFTPGSDPVNGFLDSYAWTPQSSLSSSVDPNPVASPTTNTTYVVTVQDNNGCIDRDTVTISVLDAPVADAGPDVINSCNGAPVIIGGNPSAMEGTPPYTYSWAPTAGLSSTTDPNPLANPAVDTEYTLTVTDANGCSDEDVVEVRVVNGPVANAGVDIQVCSDVDVTLGGIPTAAGGNPPYTYSWSPTNGLSNPNVANPVFNATNFTALPVPYSFTVTVTDQYGCEASDVIEVTLMPAVIVDAGLDREICWGKSTQLGGVATATNGVPPYSYTWGPTVGLITPHVSNPVVTPTSSTIYTVSVEDDNGCIGEDEVTVIVNPLPMAEAGPDQTICKGTTVQIGGLPTANGGLAPYTYSWSPYIGLSDDNVPNPLAGPSVTETFTLTVTDAKGCQDNDVVTVFVVENPVAAAGKDKEICLGNSIELGAKPAASNGEPPYNYKWDGPNLDNNTHENPVASPTDVGSDTYYLTVWDANNCKDVDSMVLTVNPLPEPEITNIALNYCVNDPIITLNGEPSGGVYAGPGVSGSTFNPGNAGIGTHEITYTYTDSNGCTGSVSYIVQVHGLPIIYAGPDKTVYLGFSTTLDAVSGGNYIYIWNPGIFLNDSTSLNPDVELPTQTTTYIITATDAYGCESSDEVTVFVDFNTPLDPPNTFTPNGDGINDTWEIPLLEFFQENNVKVYNRWGQLVFEADNYSSGNAWTGDDLPEGTYFYVITVGAQGDRVHRGTVTIVR